MIQWGQSPYALPLARFGATTEAILYQLLFVAAVIAGLTVSASLCVATVWFSLKAWEADAPVESAFFAIVCGGTVAIIVGVVAATW